LIAAIGRPPIPWKPPPVGWNPPWPGAWPCTSGNDARTQWFRAAECAEQLTALVPVLASAAELVGCTGVLRNTADADSLTIPLCTDPAKHHVRRVWEAWQTTGGRTARWGALAALGVEIRAHRSPAKITAFAEPRPYEYMWVPGPRGGHEKAWRDPHDGGTEFKPVDDAAIWNGALSASVWSA
jgi:hypothetical protein